MFFNKLIKGKNPLRKEPAYEALVAAFCLVSFADGQLHTAELTRFLRIEQRDNPDLIPDEDTLMRDIVAFGKELERDYAKTKEEALKMIARGAEIPGIARQIIKVTQVTAISDNRITKSEDNIAAEIAQALGMSGTI